VVDESASMSGQKIQAVNHAIKSVLPDIRRIEDGERVNILMRAIKFGDHAGWHVGPAPVPVKQFDWQDMDARGGSTSTAQAIELLVEELALDKIVRKNVPPVAILLSDGYCTDPESRYNQAQLDQFITPYLRKEAHLETLPAPDVRSLVEHIRVVSTEAASASASSKSDSNDNNSMPVRINVKALRAGDGPGVRTPNPGDVI
ncbi:MAG: vWA domain-containing protein, partial [Methylocella sp.]